MWPVFGTYSFFTELLSAWLADHIYRLGTMKTIGLQIPEIALIAIFVFSAVSRGSESASWSGISAAVSLGERSTEEFRFIEEQAVRVFCCNKAKAKKFSCS